MNEIDRKAIEQVLPCYLLHTVAQSLHARDGLVIREDLAQALRVGMLAPLKSNDDLVFKARLVVMEKDGYAIASAPNSDNMRELLIAASMWVVKMVDDGLFADAQNSGVLTALSLLEEQKDYPEGWGDCKQSSKFAGAILNRCMLMGYYLPDKSQIN